MKPSLQVKQQEQMVFPLDSTRTPGVLISLIPVVQAEASSIQKVIGMYGETIKVPCNNGDNKPEDLMFTKWKHLRENSTSGDILVKQHQKEEAKITATDGYKDRVSIGPDSSLLIKNAILDDQRVFTCLLVSMNNVNEYPVEVEVHKRPSAPEFRNKASQLDDGKLTPLGECVAASANPPAEIIWEKNNKPLVADNKLIIVHTSVKKDPTTGLSTTTSQLQYTAGKQDATSKFACVVKHVSGPDQISAPENFSIHWSPKAVVSIKPHTHVFIGEIVTLRCDIQGGGNTQWTYSWNKDNNKLYSDGNKRYFIYTMQGFRIWSVEDSDSGTYTCRGHRGYSQSSEISNDVTLTVSVKPKPTVRLNPQSSVYTGDTVTLSCELQQETGWEFQWYRNNQLLQNLNSEQVNTLKVTIDNAGETEYTCWAHRINNYNYYMTQFSDPVKIKVRSRPKPVVYINPDNQVFSGDTVTLRCDIQDESVSSWQYSWYKDTSHRPVSSEQVYSISGVEVTHTGTYTCRGTERGGSRSSHSSDVITLTVSERPQAVLSVSPHSWLTEGDSVTLSCEVTDSSTDWTFSWYTVVPYRDGLTGINNNRGYIVYVELLSDSSRGSGGKYTLSPAALKHTGVYMCRGERGEPALHTQYSNLQPLWIIGESPPVSLIINPSRTQHFTNDSLSLSCEDQSKSTGWTVRRYTHSERVLDCSHWGSVTGSTCNISFLSTSYTGVYWCESESGENSNPVNITVHDGDVILESPVHPVTEGHPLTLRCLYHNPNPSNLRADFYKDGSVLQNQTTGEMIIQTVSKSDEGFYHCEHPERGESLKSWVSVRRPSPVEAPFSVLMLICSVVTASPYLLVTIILLLICYRARGHTDEDRIKNAVIE
ncbi:hemicentin-1-like isoform X2 [Tachysurus fulvidraco]|uniref:hemicentin-1-like isoform X2 n=1 Tax=Tachysurus fulvidraco TaxID=1234273 RepID=UPI001FF010FB|nr:hemicentin-1-like isoform X2 [Tachysurus fulvidraco]